MMFSTTNIKTERKLEKTKAKETKKKLVSNIIDEDSYKETAGLTIDTISNTLMKSLGYYGSTTIINEGVERNITKDGYTILTSIRFQDPIATAILNFIKEVSVSLVKSVGDGSTSSVINSHAMFKEINNRLHSSKEYYGLRKYSRKEISDTLNKMKDLIAEELKKKATPINKDNFHKLKDIATVSNNNDENLGNLVYEIFEQIGNKGFIFPEISDNEEDYYTLTKGIESKYNLIDKIFINDKENYATNFINPNFVIVNSKLDKTDIDWASGIIANTKPFTGEGLVFIAPDFSLEFIQFIKNNILSNREHGQYKAMEGEFELALAKFSNNPEELEDLAIYTNGKVIDKANMSKDDFYTEIAEPLSDLSGQRTMEWLTFKATFIGNSERIIIDNYKTQIINGKGNGTQRLKDRIIEINNEIVYHEDMKSEEALIKIAKLQKRANSLNNSIAKLFVGGSSFAEKNTRKYLVEDSVHASKSALEYGYISGGNLSVGKVIKGINVSELNELEYIILEVISESSLEVYKRVLENYSRYEDDKIAEIIDICVKDDAIYNIKSEKFEKDNETDIINSVETDIKILETTISIIGLIALSNQFLSQSVIPV